MVREEERKLLREQVEIEKAVHSINSALWVHKKDGRPVGVKKWCSKCKKSNHDTLDCQADITCDYCYKKGHIPKIYSLKKANDKVKERKDTKDQKDDSLLDLGGVARQDTFGF